MQPTSTFRAIKTLREIEREYLIATLHIFGFRRDLAARALGVPEQRVSRLMRIHRIATPVVACL